MRKLQNVMPNQAEEQAEEVIGNSSKPSTHKSANDVTNQKQEVEGSRDFGACGSRSWRYNSLFFCVIFFTFKISPDLNFFPSFVTGYHSSDAGL
jgi:hypothetical protein